MMRPVLSESEYRALRGSEKQKYHRITGEKHKLVQMCYSCVPGDDKLLKGCKTPSNSVGMDVDFDPNDPEYEQKMAEVPERVLAKKEELGLLMLERSARKGYHIVFKRRAELSQEENLRWASEVLGVRFDEGAKDITRVFFTTTDSPEDLIYLNPALFEQGTGLQPALDGISPANPAAPAVQPVVPLRSTRASSGSNPSGIVASSHDSAAREVANNSSLLTPNFSLNYQGISYDLIISKYWELFNYGKEPCEGNRNALTFELAMVLRAICDYDQKKLESLIPRYDGLPEEEWRMTISNALKEPRKGMPSRLRQVLAALKEVKRIELTGGTMTSPPPMPKELPSLIKLLTKNVPDFYKPAVASAVFPALGTHLHGVRFRYIDNVDHEPTFMNLLVGCQSVGKGCIKKPIEYIMDDIKKRDEPMRRREAEWKRQNPAGKTKAKDPRPTDICIQMLIDNLTDAVFNQRVVDAHNNGQRFVYTMVDEVEALKKVTSRGTVDEVTLLIRKAFDNSLHGQERVSADSVSGIAPLRWNWNASTTPPNARRFFTRAVSDGTVSRLDVCTIFKEENKAFEIPVMGIYDEQFALELKSFNDHLDCANGLIECPQANALADELVKESHSTADQMESEAFRTLACRGVVIAWLKGLVLYISEGYRWTPEIAEFMRWSLHYNMWCKMLYFGQQLEVEMVEEKKIMNQYGQQNLLMLLPAEFTREEYYQLRIRCGKEGKGDSTLRVWISRGYVVWDEIANRFINKRIRASGQ